MKLALIQTHVKACDCEVCFTSGSAKYNFLQNKLRQSKKKMEISLGKVHFAITYRSGERIKWNDSWRWSNRSPRTKAGPWSEEQTQTRCRASCACSYTSPSPVPPSDPLPLSIVALFPDIRRRNRRVLRRFQRERLRDCLFVCFTSLSMRVLLWLGGVDLSEERSSAAFAQRIAICDLRSSLFVWFSSISRSLSISPLSAVYGVWVRVLVLVEDGGEERLKKRAPNVCLLNDKMSSELA